MEADGEQRVSTAAPPLAMAAVLLALLCAALYASSGASEFVGADYAAIVENAAVRWRELSLAHVRDAFARPHPVVQLSYGLNYRLGRLDVHGYHAVNTAIHVANALLVFALGRALFRRAAPPRGWTSPTRLRRGRRSRARRCSRRIRSRSRR